MEKQQTTTGQELEALLELASTGSSGDTALAMVEVYESIERSYRAAVMAGEIQPGVARSTNY